MTVFIACFCSFAVCAIKPRKIFAVPQENLCSCFCCCWFCCLLPQRPPSSSSLPTPRAAARATAATVICPLNKKIKASVKCARSYLDTGRGGSRWHCTGHGYAHVFGTFFGFWGLNPPQRAPKSGFCMEKHLIGCLVGKSWFLTVSIRHKSRITKKTG